MHSKVFSAQAFGLSPKIIEVEVDIGKGMRSFTIVGLPDKAVEEAKDRITAAIKNSGYESPAKGNKKIIVSLAPADLKKEGPAFDMGIALAFLLAREDIVFDPKGKLFLGELALDGTVRPIRGSLLLAREAAKKGFSEIYVPVENAREAAIIPDIAVYGVRSLSELVEHLSGRLSPAQAKTLLRRRGVVRGPLKPARLSREPRTDVSLSRENDENLLDFSEIKGQETAKRGLVIAAAGRHNIALYGPPGTGKTMLAKAFLGILPSLTFEESLEATGIHSVAGMLDGDYLSTPPLRAPHHTSSYVALVGGGTIPRPGEITLAHHGVLFLDEFPEFERRVIESLRQPLEDRVVRISRARGTVSFPANFILIAAMNPCPCGNRGVRGKTCVCLPSSFSRYERKVSGPIVDRIDLWVNVPQLDYEKLSEEGGEGNLSKILRAEVKDARERQTRRFSDSNITTNSQMGVRELKRFAPLSPAVTKTLNQSAERLGLSARSYHRVIKLARTIADLAGEEKINENHLLEALQYRPRASL